MRINHETYRRAATAAIFASIFHLVLTCVVFVLGYVVGDDATRVAAYSMVCGLPIWVILVLLFHQHRLERLEALEHEQLRSRADAAGSIFEFDENETALHGSRLKWMHRLLVPSISLAIALLYIGLGLWQRGVIEGRTLDPMSATSQAPGVRVAAVASAGYGIGITAAIALVCFVVSWFLGGMSRQPAWRLLRAGATVTVGAALVNGALAVGYGFRVNGNAAVLEFLGHALPIYMMALGLEIGVAFILNLYTPRKPGEYPQPAFDSRILGLLAAPESVVKSINDAINYQFGFSVTSTWFYQLLSRQIVPLAGFMALLIVLLNCVAIVQPNEQGIVMSFGRLARGGEVFSSGPILKWPWERVARYPVAEIHQVLVGTEAAADPSKDTQDTPILWDNTHALGKEELIIVGPDRLARTGDSNGDASSTLARSIAVVNAEVPVQFRVKEGVDAGGRPELLNYIDFVSGGWDQRERLIRHIATRAVNRHLASLSIDQVLGPERSRLSDDLRRLIQQDLDKWNAGIEIVFVGVAGIHPPTDVAASYQEVLSAQEMSQSLVQEARRLATERLSKAAGSAALARSIAAEIERLNAMNDSDPARVEQALRVERAVLAAGGEAARKILQARADRWTAQNGQLAASIRHGSSSLPYLAAPSFYQAKEYLAAMRRALAGRQLIIVPPGVEIRTNIDLKQDPTMINLTNIGAVTDAANEALKN